MQSEKTKLLSTSLIFKENVLAYMEKSSHVFFEDKIPNLRGGKEVIKKNIKILDIRFEI
jgi:hypothetical protein